MITTKKSYNFVFDDKNIGPIDILRAFKIKYFF